MWHLDRFPRDFIPMEFDNFHFLALDQSTTYTSITLKHHLVEDCRIMRKWLSFLSLHRFTNEILQLEEDVKIVFGDGMIKFQPPLRSWGPNGPLDFSSWILFIQQNCVQYDGITILPNSSVQKNYVSANLYFVNEYYPTKLCSVRWHDDNATWL